VFGKDGPHTIRGTKDDVFVIGLVVEQQHVKEVHESGFDGFYTYVVLMLWRSWWCWCRLCCCSCCSCCISAAATVVTVVFPPPPSLVSLWPTRYFAADGFSYGSTTRNWRGLQTSSRQHISMSGSNRPLLFMPSVGPGYHDTAVRPWNGINTHTRDGCAR
jgi:hypothetical protein